MAGSEAAGANVSAGPYLIAIIKAAYNEEAGPGIPYELTEVLLCEKFGWTQDELDEADAVRLLVGLELSSLYDVAKKAQKGEALTDPEHAAYGQALELELEYERTRDKDHR